VSARFDDVVVMRTSSSNRSETVPASAVTSATVTSATVTSATVTSATVTSATVTSQTQFAVRIERVRSTLRVVATAGDTEARMKRLVASFVGGPDGVSLCVARGDQEQLLTTDVIASHPALSATLRLIADEVDCGRPPDSALLDLLFGSLDIYVQRIETAHPRPKWGRPIRHRQIERAIELLNRDIDKRWTVERLARAVGLSRPAFARQFQQTLGLSPMKYLTEKRMLLAAAMLFDSDASLAEIARRVGYRSEFAFSRAFKRQFEVCPSEYRRVSTDASGTVVQLRPPTSTVPRSRTRAMRLAA